jgi:hypothetical protein
LKQATDTRWCQPATSQHHSMWQRYACDAPVNILYDEHICIEEHTNGLAASAFVCWCATRTKHVSACTADPVLVATMLDNLL